MKSAALASMVAFAAGARGIDCNGNAALCDRKFSNVTSIGAHNSPFVGIGPSDNQLQDVAAQLTQGIRFLTAQTHDSDGAVELCHTECYLEDAGTLQSFLSTVKTFMDANANEVVTLLITNEDAIDINLFAGAFTGSGLDSYVYTPTADLALDDWPTLGELISSQKRVVVFMDYNADTSKVAYILDEFKYYFETPFDPQEAALTQCDLDRPAGASPDGLMYIVNHNRNIELIGDITIPDLAEAEDTNSLDSILAHSNVCISKYQRDPNVVLIDYTSIGDAISAQANLNGI